MALFLFLKRSFPRLSVNTQFPASCFTSKATSLLFHTATSSDNEYDYDVENKDEMRAKYESFPNPEKKERRFNNFKETLATNTNPFNCLGINCMADVSPYEINGFLRDQIRDPNPYYCPPPPPWSHPKTPPFHHVDYAKAKKERSKKK